MAGLPQLQAWVGMEGAGRPWGAVWYPDIVRGGCRSCPTSGHTAASRAAALPDPPSPCRRCPPAPHQQDGSRRRRWPCRGWGPAPAPLGPAVSKMTSFRQILPRAAAGQTPLLQPAGCGRGCRRDAGGPAALPGPGLREVTGVCARPGFLAPSHAHARRRPLPGPPGRGEGALNNRRL